MKFSGGFFMPLERCSFLFIFASDTLSLSAFWIKLTHFNPEHLNNSPDCIKTEKSLKEEHSANIRNPDKAKNKKVSPENQRDLFIS